MISRFNSFVENVKHLRFSYLPIISIRFITKSLNRLNLSFSAFSLCFDVMEKKNH